MSSLRIDLARIAASVARADECRNIEHRRRGGDTYVVGYESRRQLQEVQRYCHRRGIPVTPGGGGLSGGLVGLPGAGVVLRGLDRSVERVGAGLYRVHAGTTWHETVLALRASRRVPTVVHSALDATVAGSISLGGFGPRSFRRGPQCDHVRGLGLVLADGTEVMASRSENPALLQAALCGFGAIGTIEHALLESQPARTARYSMQAELPDLRRGLLLLREMAALDCQPDALFLRLTEHGLIVQVECDAVVWRALRPLLAGARVAPRPPASRAPAATGAARRFAGRPIWRQFVVSLSAFFAIRRSLESVLRDATDSSVGWRVLLGPTRCGHEDGDAAPLLSPLRRLRGEWGVGIGVHLFARPGTVRAARALQRRVRAACVAAGGVPYAQAVVESSEAELRRFFRSGLERWRDIKDRVDPDGRMSPLVSRRLIGRHGREPV
jgi:FAD/FMN-containing dehydrogenase